MSEAIHQCGVSTCSDAVFNTLFYVSHSHAGSINSIKDIMFY